MRKRVIVMVAVVVLGAVGMVIIMFGAFNGRYVQAADMARDDLAVNGSASELANDLRAADGVDSVEMQFTSSFFGYRTVALRIATTPSSEIDQLSTVTGIAFDSAVEWPATTFTLTLTDPDAAAIVFTAKPDSAATDLATWRDVTLAAGVPTVREVGEGEAVTRIEGDAVNLLPLLSTRRDSLVGIDSQWRLPGFCEPGPLPSSAALDLVAALAASVPFASCDLSSPTSGLSVYGVFPDGRLNVGMGYVADGTIEPVTKHLDAFTSVASIFLEPEAASANVFFVSGTDPAFSYLRFFSGECSGSVSQPDGAGSGAEIAEVLAGQGIAIPDDRRGQCDWPEAVAP